MKEAVRELLRVKQEVFMQMIHRMGEAQVDFGYALAKVSSRCPSGCFQIQLDFLGRVR